MAHTQMMTGKKKIWAAATFLVLLHTVIVFAGFVAPYDPVSQNRNLPFVPPTRPRFVDAQGHFRLRPFIYPWVSRPQGLYEYEESRDREYPIHFLAKGPEYKVAGLFSAHTHLFGTEAPVQIFLAGSDNYGRDQFSRILYGGRISLAAGLLATLISLSLGLLLGTISGFYGRWIDELLMRTAELFLVLPWLYLLLAVRAFLPLHISPIQTFFLLVAVIGSVGWARPARLVRGVVLSAKTRKYVVASRGFGASNAYILRRHVLPHTYGVLLTQAALLVPQYVIAEVTLSFLGLGLSEPLPSWGNLLANLQQYNVLVSYWWMFAPGLALVVFSLGYLAVADAFLKRLQSTTVKKIRPLDLMRRLAWIAVLVSVIGPASLAFSSPHPTQPERPQSSEELQVTDNRVGHYGGTLVVAQGAEPKTLNPVTAADARSREVIGRMTADLIHINRDSQKTEPALAKSWTTSRDGRVFTLKLRRGLRFSDGQPFDADDVVFSFQVYLDEKIHSPQRDLLIVGGKPIAVQKIDSHTVRFTLTQPYAAAERIFDSLAMMPRHLLEKAYREDRFTQVWNVNTSSAEIAGLGPFRLKQYVPGQRIVLERNPYFWKIDQKKNRLPYLDELVFLFAGNEDAQVIRFQAGDTDIMSRINAENYILLSRDAQRGYELFDLGPSLEYNFLLFNLNDVKAPTASKLAPQLSWFSNLKFRQAVGSAIDREAIVKLVYAGRGMPLWGNVSPSNKLWMDQSLPHPPRSVEHARDFLKSAGFSWRNDGRLLDSQNRPVEFSIIASSSNNQRTKIATMIQDDLSQLGMDVHVVPLEFRALLDRVFQTFDYEAAVMGLGGGDADPNPEMNVWLSNGSTHLWHLGETKPATDWEAQIDQLIQKQMVELNYGGRKRLYDQVQEIIAANLPYVFLATPNILVGAKKNLENFKPAILEPTALWNVEQVYFRQESGAAGGAKR